MAQTALREGVVDASSHVLCTLDARIKEVYSAVYAFEDGRAVLKEGPWACAPAELAPGGNTPLRAIGSGCHFLDSFRASLQSRIQNSFPDVLPAARDIVPLALEKFRCGEIQASRNVQPVYVRDEISWKKLADQGKRL
jgi:tRNA threonylcarbamoyladenosine biosynthesis protein TsaB